MERFNDGVGVGVDVDVDGVDNLDADETVVVLVDVVELSRKLARSSQLSLPCLLMTLRSASELLLPFRALSSLGSHGRSLSDTIINIIIPSLPLTPSSLITL